jgi:phosphatidylethanolamine/phosphatidyl-N-methylethanolamine N-methyltransferase
MAKHTLEFFKAALRNPLDVSTVFPTSKALAETMLGFADLARARRVVELGSGTGAITKHLAPKLTDPSVFIGVELDPKMVEFLRQEWPALRFETGLAEAIPQWVAPGSVDVIVSSLPWTIFSEETQTKTIAAVRDSLRPGGAFVTYVCANALLYPHAGSFLKLLRTEFSSLKRSELEWRNIPPAFVYRGIK